MPTGSLWVAKHMRHLPCVSVISSIRSSSIFKIYCRSKVPTRTNAVSVRSVGEPERFTLPSLLKDVAERSLFERSELRFVCSVAEDVKTFINWLRRHDEAIYKKELLFIGGRYMKLSRLINSK